MFLCFIRSGDFGQVQLIFVLISAGAEGATDAVSYQEEQEELHVLSVSLPSPLYVDIIC